MSGGPDPTPRDEAAINGAPGSFVGNTPSTMNPAPGKHDIVVKKAGYKDWTRSMNVASGAIRVSADMVAVQ